MEKQRNHQEEVDRISQLPIDLLHHILCYLSPKQALQTCVLSKSWRHIGPTRPKIKFREDFFNGDEIYLSVLDKTLQMYHDQKLSIQEIIIVGIKEGPESFELLGKWVPIVLQNMGVNLFALSINFSEPGSLKNSFRLPSSVFSKTESLTELHLVNCQIDPLVDDEKVLCKHLRKLRLHIVYNADATLEKIISSCPLIEYLGMSSCMGLQTIKLTSSVLLKAEFLEELNLDGFQISPLVDDEKVHCKRLRKLCLHTVYITDATLEKIISSCPLIEYLVLNTCEGLQTTKLSKAPNLKFFSSLGDCPSIEIIDAPSIESIDIDHCPSWIQNYFPRLKSLRLEKVRLSNESIDKFSTNLPCLENLTLSRFSNSEQFKISSRTIKHLTIWVQGPSLKAAIIDATNILSFKFSCEFLPTSFSFTTTSTEWKSKVCVAPTLEFRNGASSSSWFHRLSEIFKALSTSQISLHVYGIPPVVPDYCGVVLLPFEDLSLAVLSSEEEKSFSSVPVFLNCLFRNFRPRNIQQIWYADHHPWYEEKKNKLIELLSKILLWRSERAQYFGKLNLEDVKMEASYENEEEWRGVEGTSSLSEFALPWNSLKIRFRLKWRIE